MGACVNLGTLYEKAAVRVEPRTRRRRPPITRRPVMGTARRVAIISDDSTRRAAASVSTSYRPRHSTRRPARAAMATDANHSRGSLEDRNPTSNVSTWSLVDGASQRVVHPHRRSPAALSSGCAKAEPSGAVRSDQPASGGMTASAIAAPPPPPPSAEPTPLATATPVEQEQSKRKGEAAASASAPPAPGHTMMRSPTGQASCGAGTCSADPKKKK